MYFRCYCSCILVVNFIFISLNLAFVWWSIMSKINIGGKNNAIELLKSIKFHLRMHITVKKTGLTHKLFEKIGISTLSLVILVSIHYSLVWYTDCAKVVAFFCDLNVRIQEISNSKCSNCRFHYHLCMHTRQTRPFLNSNLNPIQTFTEAFEWIDDEKKDNK